MDKREFEQLSIFNFDGSMGCVEPSKEPKYKENGVRYGICYQGSKARIAEKIIDMLPSGARLVDLFGGGGAITHCAMLSGKWDKHLYNDLNPLITSLFVDAVNGKYKDEHRVITRADFEAHKNDDGYVKYLWSFGNNGRTYLWGREIEDIKLEACRMLMGETLHERRMAYKRFIRMLQNGSELKDSQLQSLERLQSLQSLQRLQSLQSLQRLEVSNIDYRDCEYQEGDVVYCDIPYEQADGKPCREYGVKFDNMAFYEWAKTRPYQVWFSSYDISDDSFYAKAVGNVKRLMDNASKNKSITENLYSNRPF